MSDFLVPIVYTEYMIAVPTASIDLPKIFNNIGIPDLKTPAKVADLGHAAIMFANGKSGLTKYYEYGRYDRAGKGLVRSTGIPDLKINKGGQIDHKSFVAVLSALAKKCGQNSKIKGAYIEAPGKFGEVLKFAQKREEQNKNPDRKSYELHANSCLHFMRDAIEAAGLSTPWLLDPRPVSYIEEIRDMYRDLDFDPRAGKLVIAKQ